MSHPSHPRRIALVTAAAVAGLALAAPQWVAATPAEPVADPTLPAVSAPASADALSGPALPEVVAAVATAAPSAPLVVEVPEPAPAPAPQIVVEAAVEAPVVVPAPPIVPAAPAAPAPRVAEPAAPAARTTGSITVHVGTADGATRTVSLQTPDGDAVGERTTVTGDPISFADLGPGTYEVFVEQVADGGGTFLTRTVVTVAAGEDRAVTCHGESLECSA